MEIARLAVLTNPPISDHMGLYELSSGGGIERLACSVNTGLAKSWFTAGTTNQKE